MYWPKSKVQIVLTVLMTLAFLGSGIMKLTGADMVESDFRGLGLPDSVRLLPRPLRGGGGRRPVAAALLLRRQSLLHHSHGGLRC